ncbi:MAG: peroxiredoxin [Actinomycetota bacterium]|nr:peroxiredoxin [Actinomycetota bacterium]
MASPLRPPVGVGDPAPDFVLAGTGGRHYALAEERGEPVVLVFYPGDNTPVCTRQLVSYSADLPDFTELGARLLALSPQDVASHEAFAAQHDLGFPLLADTDKAVAEAYGVLGPLGFYRRSVFVIDAEGVVRYAHRAVAGMRFRTSDELVAAVRAAQVAGSAS